MSGEQYLGAHLDMSQFSDEDLHAPELDQRLRNAVNVPIRPLDDAWDAGLQKIREDAAQRKPPEPTTNVVSIGREHRRTSRVALLSAAAAVVLTLAGATAIYRVSQQSAGTLYRGDEGAYARISDTESGLRIELDAPQLDRLPDGEFYQGWLRSKDGTRLVPIGTFHSGDDVTLWAGVTLDEFPALTVTREPDDGNPASSGNRVLFISLTPR